MTTQQNSERNWQFDFLKGISCILVVLLHCRFSGVVGDIIIYSCRFPVPFFFMINGYYCYAKECAWIKEKAFSILKMLFLTELFYGVWSCLEVFLFGETSVTDYLKVKGMSILAHPIRTLLCGTLLTEYCGIYTRIFGPIVFYMLYHVKTN